MGGDMDTPLEEGGLGAGPKSRKRAAAGANLQARRGKAAITGNLTETVKHTGSLHPPDS